VVPIYTYQKAGKKQGCEEKISRPGNHPLRNSSSFKDFRQESGAKNFMLRTAGP
jgi:hypothetical protein